MNTYIVTGTTRGIGRALAEAILANGDQLLSLSSARDGIDGNRVNVRCNLSRSETVVPCLERLLASGQPTTHGAMILINNAGVLDPIGPIGHVPEDQIVGHLQVNQAAPFILMSAFIHLTSSFSGNRRIVNISSGAARHPYAGWGLYCASKAALEMITLCAAREQAVRKNPVSICAVSPGKVETDMQASIRRINPDRFPAQAQFVKAKMNGELLAPQAVAGLLIALDNKGLFKNGGIYDLRNTVHDKGELYIEPIAVPMYE